MRVLITGGAGFIGSHIVEHFQGKAEVVILDNFRSGQRSNCAPFSCELIEGSILDPVKLAQAMRSVDYVYHCAAMISVPESMLHPRDCVEINTQGTLRVLEAAVAAKVKKVVLASSAAIYGDNPVVPKVETMNPEPKSPYAITKLDGEYYLELFRREHSLATSSLRFFNVFGPRQDPQSPYAAAVPIFIQKALRGENISIFGDGEQTRDFIFVKDIVRALVFAAQTPALSGTFNVGYGKKITIRHLAEEVIRHTQSKSRLVFQPERLGDVKHSMASADKLKNAGWKPEYTVESGLALTIQSFLKTKA